jgi:Fe-S-cluster containining protein
LLKRAAAGDEFARGFFSIMIPYASHQEAEQVVPGIVERSLRAVKKLNDFDGEKDVVFYHCRYQTDDNKCGVWEDRPQFCRDYPDTPFVVMAPGCAFESWGTACRKKYADLKEEVSHLKALKAELAKLQRLRNPAGSMEPEMPDSERSSEEADSGRDELTSTLEAASTALSLDSLDWERLTNEPKLQAAYQHDSLSLMLSLTPLYVGSPLRSMYYLRQPGFFE